MNREAENFFNSYPLTGSSELGSSFYKQNEREKSFVPSSSFSKARLSMRKANQEESASPVESETEQSPKHHHLYDDECDIEGQPDYRSNDQYSENTSGETEMADSLTITYYSKNTSGKPTSPNPHSRRSITTKEEEDSSDNDDDDNENITFFYYTRKPNKPIPPPKPPKPIVFTPVSDKVLAIDSPTMANLALGSPYYSSSNKHSEVDDDIVEGNDYTITDSGDYGMYEHEASFVNNNSYSTDYNEYDNTEPMDNRTDDPIPDSLTVTYYSKRTQQSQHVDIPKPPNRFSPYNINYSSSNYANNDNKQSQWKPPPPPPRPSIYEPPNEFNKSIKSKTVSEYVEEDEADNHYDEEAEDTYANEEETVDFGNTSTNGNNMSNKSTPVKAQSKRSIATFSDKVESIQIENNDEIDEANNYYDYYEYDDEDGDAYIEEKMDEKDFDSPLPPKGNNVQRMKSFNRVDVMPSRKDSMPVGGKNQDYLALARLYKLERPYQDPGYKAVCVLCHANLCADVFFPCQHRCVCRKCIKSENICDERAMQTNPKGYCNCSLCASVIKLILPNEGGDEVEKYWKWVYEEPVELPPQFMKDFRHSADVIRAVYLEDHDEKKKSDCSIS